MPTAPDTQVLGQGRSGVVFRSRDAAGRDVARKVFLSGGLASLVHYVVFGAPNPYAWSESAIRSAALRRRILDTLVRSWFGSKLRVARAIGYGWNGKHRAFELSCELIDGRHLALHHPFSSLDEEQLQILRDIMQQLQARLIEAGFDGLVWQAGRGNPVALNNFMCERGAGDAGNRWVWIDLESGVPALIPCNPLDLVLFYLPKSFRHRRPLFDDVDIPKLRAWIEGDGQETLARLDQDSRHQLERDIDGLDTSQQQWKSLARHRRSLAHRVAKGQISPQQAAWYADRPVRWYGREVRRGLASGVRSGVRLLAGAVSRLARIKLRLALMGVWLFVSSQAYRARIARDYVSSRIACWRGRRQLTESEAACLRASLESDEASTYLTDFAVHLSVKPVVKGMQWVILPALWTVGVIDATALAVLVAGGGAVARTLYTLGRLLQNTRLGVDKPWIALVVGTMPVLGNLAYPLQILRTSASEEAAVAQFILYDAFSRIGQVFPIWGGPDTLTEHLLNRCPDVLVRLRRTRTAPMVSVNNSIP
jgi:hypothetical protein